MILKLIFSDSKSWSVPRPGYSYSDRFSFNNDNSNDNMSLSAREFGDIIAADSNKRHEGEDFESKKNRLNSRLPMPGGEYLLLKTIIY
jgi:hypothetical protein